MIDKKVTTTNMDTLNRFLFDNHPIRGEITRLEQTYQAILDNHNYPIAVQKLLGELLVATSLLTARSEERRVGKECRWRVSQYY